MNGNADIHWRRATATASGAVAVFVLLMTASAPSAQLSVPADPNVGRPPVIAPTTPAAPSVELPAAAPPPPAAQGAATQGTTTPIPEPTRGEGSGAKGVGEKVTEKKAPQVTGFPELNQGEGNSQALLR